MSSKNKFKYRSFQGKRKYSYRLEAGLSGFLCTCNSKIQEKDCIRESYSLLNEFADKIFGPEESLSTHEEKTKPDERLVNKEEEEEEEKTVNKEEEEEDDEDIDESLKKEVESIKAEMNKKPEQRRFQVIESGANAVVFIRSTVPDPVKLAHTIVTSLSQTQKSKFLLRLLPVEITCKAYIKDICDACDPLFDKYFSGEGKTFAIVFNHRNNDSIKRDELISKVADLVLNKSDKNKTDLKHPQLAVLLEVIRSICCISVVPDFYELKKYNLLELASKNKKGEESEKDIVAKDNKEDIVEKGEVCVEKMQD